eukprot:3718381-Rhodomonas_salina.2
MAQLEGLMGTLDQRLQSQVQMQQNQMQQLQNQMQQNQLQVLALLRNQKLEVKKHSPPGRGWRSAPTAREGHSRPCSSPRSSAGPSPPSAASARPDQHAPA